MRITRLWGAALGITLAACGGVSNKEVKTELHDMLAAKAPPAELKGAPWDVIQDLYKARQGQPLWLDGDKPRSSARDLVDAIAESDREGLRASDYDLDGLQAALRSTYDSGTVTAARLAQLELRLSSLYLAYGADLLVGRVDPAVVNDGWLAKTRRHTADSILVAAATTEDFGHMIGELRPRMDQYQALLDGLKRYRAVADSGGWKTIPGGPIKPGERSGRVTLLRARLAATGDLGDAHGDSVLDNDLEAAVNRFRARHDLDTVPGVDRATLSALNVPAEQRVRQIELNLDRLRWIPNDFGDRYVLVNIPEYRLRAFDGGKQVLSMKVVVGKDYQHATPVFADTMSTVIFHPDWNVPHDIVTREIMPHAKDDDEYLASHDYVVIDTSKGRKIVKPGDVDWGADTADFHYLVRQQAGDDNALGDIKFLFPNRFAVYMHDTPARSLFKRRDRAASHGCVRLADPVAFARYVLAPEKGWDEDRIRKALADTAQKAVPVTHTLPVYLLYLTAFPEDGRIQFREDVYGSDRRALAHLGTPAPDSTIAPLRKRLDKLMRG